MSVSTVDPALAELDPAGYVEAVAALAIHDEDPRWREQAALWRGVARRHQPSVGVRGETCDHCRASYVPCLDLRAVVAAAKAYPGGGDA